MNHTLVGCGEVESYQVDGLLKWIAIDRMKGVAACCTNSIIK